MGRPREEGRRTSVIALAAVGLAFALAPACALVEPEVGDPLGPCADADSDPNATVSFKAQVRPLMGGAHGARACGDCHAEGKNTQEGFLASHLDVTTLGKLRKGGTNTADDIIVPGSPCKSAVVEKLRGTYAGARMPKGGPYWSPEDIQVMMDWIAEGAKGADDE